METLGSKLSMYEVLPVMRVRDGVIISKYGDVTIGWEMSLPVVHSLTEEGYDGIVNTFVAAAKLLPAWTMIHRQDVFTHEYYEGEYRGKYLADSHQEHFDGREYQAHRQFLYLTMTKKSTVLRSNSQTAAFGIRFSAKLPEEARLAEFETKAEEFISVLTSCDSLGARRLTQEELEGNASRCGLIDSYMNLFGDPAFRSDMVWSPDSVRVGDKYLMGFKVSEAEDLPGEVPNIIKTNGADSGYELFLSYGSPLGVRLDCEHVVNQYILMPKQQDVLRDLDRKMKKMISMEKQAENRVNAEQIDEFVDTVQKDSLMGCYSHMNVLAWCDDGEQQALRGRISAALSSMGIVATQALCDLPSLFLAGVPGGACEIGKDNLMLQELTSMLCMGLNETYDEGVEGGLIQLCDPMRNVPIRFDMQKLARKLHWIDNYNVFLLGPSGSGKSFFTNYFLQQCYDAGEHVFVIDVGDSYEGLCRIINETSGGKDGIYHTWDIAHPFSFNPFIGYRTWLDANGYIKQDDSGVSFFMSFLQTAWTPSGGWESDTLPILEVILGDFIAYAKRTVPAAELPVFDDFYRFLVTQIAPRIEPARDERGNIIRLPERPYIVGDSPVTPQQFDIAKFIRALSPYSAKGSYSFLLNDRHPKDLFSSRFTVFEVLKLSEGNELFYSICVLCIMNAFDLKMRGASGFKRMVVDEAWKAIANKTMSPYLKSLWKTARKYQTSAMVVTQELDDIISSDVIKEAILSNSDIRILLNQSKNANRFEQLSTLMGLSDHQKNLILSMGHNHNPKYFYTDVYIGMLKHCGIYSIEASLQQVYAFESDKVAKAPLYERADQLGSLTEAIDEKVFERRAG